MTKAKTDKGTPAAMVSVKITAENHKHAGKPVKVGDVITVPAGVAAMLIDAKRAEAAPDTK